MAGLQANMETICAVLPGTGSQIERNVADALEQRLSAINGVRLVNRAELKAVLNEQLLSAAMSAEGVSSRLQLGWIVKADVLILLRERKVKIEQVEQIVLDIVAAETRRGLRLAWEPAVWQEDQFDAITERFGKLARSAIGQSKQGELKIFAVPPFECRDIGSAYSFQRQGFARYVERVLAGVPGVAVVEFEEARALGNELALTAGTVSRDLPHYVLGSYKTTREDNATYFEMSLEIKGPSGFQEKQDYPRIPEANAAKVLREFLLSALSKVTTHPAEALLVEQEVQMLMDRAEMFRRTNEWDQVLPMLESVLLLDPNALEVRKRAFDGYVEMMHRGVARNSPVATRPYERSTIIMQYGHRGFDHMAVLLRRGILDSEVRSSMERFEQAAWRESYARIQEVVDLYRSLFERRMKLLNELMANPEWRARLSARGLKFIIKHAMDACYHHYMMAYCEPGVAYRRTEKLIEVFDGIPELDQSLMLDLAIKMADLRLTKEDMYLDFLDRLSQADSRRVQRVGILAKLMFQIRDQQTYDAIMKKVNDILDDPNLTEKERQHVLDTGKDRLDRWGRIARSQKLYATGGVVPMPRIMVPELRRVDQTPMWRPSTSGERPLPEHVLAWVSCGNRVDVVAGKGGLGVIESGNGWRPISPLVASKLHWDGRYVWALTESAIVVLDPRHGELCRFDQDDVVHDSNVLDGRLATTGAGQACFVGYVVGDAHAQRSWVNLLKVEMQEDGKAVGWASTFLEARGHESFIDGQKRARPFYAFRPRWIDVICSGHDPLKSTVLVYSGSNCLLIEPDARTVRWTRMSWPCGAIVIQHDGVRYVASGIFDGNRKKHYAYLFRWADLDHPFEMLIETAEYDSTAAGIACSQYFSTTSVYEGKLHGLLAGKEMMRKVNSSVVIRESEPSWIVFDLKALQSYMLVSSLENEIPRSLIEQLIVSEQFGLVLVTGGTAYQVTLPPVDQWPALDATAHPEGLKVIIKNIRKPEPLSNRSARNERKSTKERAAIAPAR